jgi:hypothetical protein
MEMNEHALEWRESVPQHEALIPDSEKEAAMRLETLIGLGPSVVSKEIFLRGWWALHWLNPGLHPDDCEEWSDPAWREIAGEAFRRGEASELDDSELYPSEASHSRLMGEMQRRANA